MTLQDQVPSPASHPYVFGWFNFMSKFADSIKKSWKPMTKAAAPAKSGKKEVKKEEVKKVVVEEKKADDDDFDPFADDDEDDEEAEKAKQARFKEIAKTAKSYGKAPAIAKSIIIWEVKPWGEETDLVELAKKIIAI